MSGVTCRLEEQLPDLRSNYGAFKFIIENTSESPVRVISVEPQIPEKVRLVEVKSTSLAAKNARRAELVDEMNKLLQQYLLVESEPFRAAWLDHQKKLFRELISATGIFRFYFDLILGNRQWQNRMKREFEALQFRIDTASDAQYAIDRWMKQPSDLLNPIVSLFVAKAAQLSHFDAEMGEGEKRSLATIQSGSTFAITYLFSFPRSHVEPWKYQVSVEAALDDQSSGASQLSSATASVLVSPYPITLSLIAVIASVLGVLTQIAIADTSTNPSFAAEVEKSFYTGGFVAAPVIALIFFNVYEHSSVGQNLSMPVSWRSALLIGALCGLANERVLAALSAFLQ